MMKQLEDLGFLDDFALISTTAKRGQIQRKTINLTGKPSTYNQYYLATNQQEEDEFTDDKEIKDDGDFVYWGPTVRNEN